MYWYFKRIIIYNKMSCLKEQLEFKKQIVKFLDELIDQFPEEADFVILRIFIKDQIGHEYILGNFTRMFYPYKILVKNKDKRSFQILDDMMNNIMRDNSSNLQTFQRIWESSELDDDDKEIMWQWMNMFMKLCENHYNKYGFISGFEYDMEDVVKDIEKKIQ